MSSYSCSCLLSKCHSCFICTDLRMSRSICQMYYWTHILTSWGTAHWFRSKGRQAARISRSNQVTVKKGSLTAFAQAERRAGPVAQEVDSSTAGTRSYSHIWSAPDHKLSPGSSSGDGLNSTRPKGGLKPALVRHDQTQKTECPPGLDSSSIFFPHAYISL